MATLTPAQLEKILRIKELKLQSKNIESAKKVNLSSVGRLVDEKEMRKFLEGLLPEIHKKITEYLSENITQPQDGYTPIKDVDYFDGKDGKDAEITDELMAEIANMVLGKIKQPKDGKDAEVSDEIVQSIVDEVIASIEIPKPPKEIDIAEKLKDMVGVVRDALESIENEDDKLKAEAIGGLEEAIKKYAPKQKVMGGGGGMTKQSVESLIDEKIAESEAASTVDWAYYVYHWSVAPTLNATITDGDVYEYTLKGTTRYRFVPSTYDPTQDAFYENFDGATLSGLIVSRG